MKSVINGLIFFVIVSFNLSKCHIRHNYFILLTTVKNNFINNWIRCDCRCRRVKIKDKRERRQVFPPPYYGGKVYSTVMGGGRNCTGENGFHKNGSDPAAFTNNNGFLGLELQWKHFESITDQASKCTHIF